MQSITNTNAANATADGSNAGTTGNLPLGPINLVVLTDVHSWIGGHERHEPSLNADYGHVLSFYEKLKDEISYRQQDDDEKRDVFMVMNGDFMDGTGLSTVPPEHLTPLLLKMPFAIVNLGNHELYHDETVDWIRHQFIPHWRGHYLTSNTLWKETGEPLGNRFAYLEGDHSTLLVFGFLYNFEGNCPSTIVERVQDVVQQKWFVDALQRQEAYDAILVMAHMHVTDPLVEVIRGAIRDVVGLTMPIQFITGHTHIRAYAPLDDHAASFEAGRFLDTVGFCSFPVKERKRSEGSGDHDADDGRDDDWVTKNNDDLLDQASGTAGPTGDAPLSPRFEHVFLDANQQALSATLAIISSSSSSSSSTRPDSVSDLDSTAGRLLSKRIHKTQEQLGLNAFVGCSPSNYQLDIAMDLPESLWGLYMYKIVPTMLSTGAENDVSSSPSFTEAKSSKQVLVQGTGAFRYDLFQGTVVLDDVIAVCPFNDTIYQITGNLTGAELLQVLNVTASKHPNLVVSSNNAKFSALPFLAISTPHAIQDDQNYDLLTSHFHRDDMVQRVERVLGHPIPDPSPVIDSRKHGPGQFWTTANLWQGYIEQEWSSCAGESERGNPRTKSNIGVDDAWSSARQDAAIPEQQRGHRRPNAPEKERPFTVVFFIVLIMGGLYLYQRRKTCLERTGYVPIGDPTMTLLRTSTGSSSRSNSGY